jgi:DNA (cytosine-5)-methyltransferase 1
MIIGESAKAYTREVIQEIRSLGYQVRAEVLNSAWYRVPQTRRRLIFLGYREDLAPDRIEFPPPSDEAPFTLAEALASVPEGDPDIETVGLRAAVGRTRDAIVEARREGREFDPRSFPCQRCERPLTDDGGHTVTRESPDGVVLAATCSDGGKAKILKDYFMLKIPDPGRPCPTITAEVSWTPASVAHPTERRFFTPWEALAISGFPPDFVLSGNIRQRGERVGRAVTPPLYEAIGKKVAEVLQGAGS